MPRRPLMTFLAILAVGGALSGCVSRPVTQDGIVIDDPFEAQNRRVHAFNKSLDARVIGPVADLASSDDTGPGADPGAMKPLDLVINAGSNLALPSKAANSLLQGRPVASLQNLSRFAVNSTLGLAGLFDPAGIHMGLTERDTDFGETLAVWGVPEGAYVELPVLGPSTQRDAFGKVVDFFADPMWLFLPTDLQKVTGFGLRVASKAGERARFGDTVDSVLQGSADSYAQTRLIYLMHRRHDVGEKEVEFDPYDDPYAAPQPDPGFIDPYAD